MRIGIIGAGQLGRMLALSGIPLGLEFRMYDRSADVPGAAVAPVATGEFDDLAALGKFARGVDVVTFDWENVPVASVRALAGIAPASPPPRALEVAQDRLAEKRLFARLGIPVAPHAAVDSPASLRRAVRRIGLPGILKTRRLGYDGKGQVRVTRADELPAALAALGGRDLIYEGLVRFSREVSLVAVRGRDGAIAFYPLAENVHEGGILSVSRAPYRSPRLQRLAERHLRSILGRLDYVGVLCVEFFVSGNQLIANEMAPRVHNSGHWTIEGAETSQFENHVRALAGLPLGSTRARGMAGMVNFIGRMPEASAVLALEGTHFHDYGKSPRPGRKLGHATALAPTAGARERRLKRLLAMAGRASQVARGPFR
jgi:5-(carboxyamino)imidazole ribonucleotide synthase